MCRASPPPGNSCAAHAHTCGQSLRRCGHSICIIRWVKTLANRRISIVTRSPSAPRATAGLSSGNRWPPLGQSMVAPRAGHGHSLGAPRASPGHSSCARRTSPGLPSGCSLHGFSVHYPRLVMLGCPFRAMLFAALELNFFSARVAVVSLAWVSQCSVGRVSGVCVASVGRLCARAWNCPRMLLFSECSRLQQRPWTNRRFLC